MCLEPIPISGFLHPDHSDLWTLYMTLLSCHFMQLLQWARQLGKKSEPRVRVPLHSCEHFYLVTKPLDGISPFMPGKVIRNISTL